MIKSRVAKRPRWIFRVDLKIDPLTSHCWNVPLIRLWCLNQQASDFKSIESTVISIAENSITRWACITAERPTVEDQWYALAQPTAKPHRSAPFRRYAPLLWIDSLSVMTANWNLMCNVPTPVPHPRFGREWPTTTMVTNNYFLIIFLKHWVFTSVLTI